MVCFSVVDPTSLENVLSIWYPELELHCPRAPRYLIGTKSDMRDDPGVLARLQSLRRLPVTVAEGSAMAKQIGELSCL